MDPITPAPLQPSAYADGFARAHLPPRDQWPDLVFDATTAAYPQRMNAAAALLDAAVARGQGDRTALIGQQGALTYAQLLARANQLARVIRDDWQLPTGSRILLRGENSPDLALAWLAVLKAGCIAVTTMPLLRARELTVIVEKAQVTAALCQHALADALVQTQAACAGLAHVLYFQAPPDHPQSADPCMDAHATTFDNVETAQDDVALIAFTSGTTGVPKGTLHFHRDVLAICDVLSRHLLDPQASDVFIGTPPLAFTFGLGGLLLFPLGRGGVDGALEPTKPDRRHRPPPSHGVLHRAHLLSANGAAGARPGFAQSALDRLIGRDAACRYPGHMAPCHGPGDDRVPGLDRNAARLHCLSARSGAPRGDGSSGAGLSGLCARARRSTCGSW